MGFIGLAKHLNFSNWFLGYNNKAVYPFYILYQTIIVAAGYHVVQWPLPDAAKFIVLVVCCLEPYFIYHFLIRPFVVTRILLRP